MKKYFNLFTLAFALLFAVVIKVNAAGCTTDCVEIGTTKYDTLKDAIAAANSGDTLKLLGDIEGVSSTIVIKTKGTIIIDGNGKTVSAESPKKVFEIYAEAGNLEVIFKNITITNSYSGIKSEGGRAIDTRTANITLTVNNSTLRTTSAANNQPLNVGGAEGPVTINLIDSNIDAGVAGYGITTFNPVNLTIDNSKVMGYAALYMKGADSSQGSEGSRVIVKNKSILTGKNNHTGESNNFGVIALEDDGININIEDSTVEATGTGGAKQVIFSQHQGLVAEKKTTINIFGESTITAKPEGYFLNQDKADVTVEPGVKANIEIPEEFLPENVKVEKDNNGNYVVEMLYDIVLPAEIKNGTVTAPKYAEAGEKVKLEIKPAKGYVLAELKVFTPDEIEIKVTDNTFEMPEEHVYVDVVFEKEVVKEAVKEEVPNTGDNVMLFVVFGFISLIGLSIIIANLKKLYN